MIQVNGLTLSIAFIAVIIFLWLYGRFVLVKASEKGFFSLFGQVYTVRLCIRDQPSNGLPEALRDPDNEAFATNTLQKIKLLKESERVRLSTMKDKNIDM
ncbi:hypothetical protein [Acinetobacter bereziniae]|uniref:hypothetical protein n=1 Tax=Acinetobacter bereziniae TaxID=106648 RepID=UPI001250B668|nr:hypothetical protein [Acinetobacter bereziniae]